MPTTWYYRNTNAPAGPTGKASPDTDSFPTVPADKNTPKDMTVAKGTAQTSQAGAYSTSTTPLYTLARIFVGSALAAQTLTGGQAGYKSGIAIKESNAQMNLYHRTFVYVWRSGSGNVKTIGGPVSCGVEHGTGEVGCVITFSGAAGDFGILLNDRIVVEEWWDIRNTKATSYTATFYYDGATDVVEATATSDAAGFFYCPQTLNLGVVIVERNVGESAISVTDSVAKAVRRDVGVSESAISVADSPVYNAQRDKAISESAISVGDATERTLKKDLSISEPSISIADSVNAEIPGAAIPREVNEAAISVSDSIQVNRYRSVEIIEVSISVSDGVQTVKYGLTFISYGLPFKFDGANWGSVSFHLEVYVRAIVGSIYARLLNETDNLEVANSVLSTTETTMQRLRSLALTLVDGKTYRCQFGKMGEDEGAFVGGKLVVI